MTVREFAEQILFSTDLTAKLASPATELRDVAIGRALATPPVPGRPSALRLDSDARQRAEFPREPELRDDRARGRLLHFFANHELLATELMALALLKFPEAPAAFRRGLLHTLREEQSHTQWYLDRMRDYGVSFGEFPVNGFFWNAVSGMSTPLDYLVRLPMTFEQANLDFALYYRDVFRRAGDCDSAALFQRIHDDEINHVSYGLKWFRKLKSPGASDWDEFSRRLIFPLSPARAKGKPPLDVEGRRSAGLDEGFIRELELFSRSRGRTPRVYFFNPAAELSLVRRDDRPDRAAAALASDLDLLPFVLARPDDVVLVRRAPDRKNLGKLNAAGVALPEVEVLDEDGSIPASSLLCERKLSGLRPWAWTPETDHVFKPLFANVGGSERVRRWHESHVRFYSKAFGAEILEELGDADAGIVARSLADVREAVRLTHSRGHLELVFKPAFGLSGRGHRRAAQLTGADEKWAESILDQHGHLIVEPWLDRVADFSVQCEFDGDRKNNSEADPPAGSRIKGFTALEVAPNGRFVACLASARFSTLVPPEVSRFFNADGRQSWLREFYLERVLPLVDRHFSPSGFCGAWGIDAFVFRDAAGKLHLRPVVEINPRFTMGRVALELLNVAAPARIVRFSLATLSTARRHGCRSLDELARHLESTEPAEITIVGGRPRLESGTLVLNDPVRAARFLGVIEVHQPSWAASLRSSPAC